MRERKRKMDEAMGLIQDAINEARSGLVNQPHHDEETYRNKLVEILLDLNQAKELLIESQRAEQWVTVSPTTPQQVPYIDTIKIVRGCKLESLGFSYNSATQKEERLTNLGLRDAKVIVDALEQAGRLSFRRTF